MIYRIAIILISLLLIVSGISCNIKNFGSKKIKKEEFKCGIESIDHEVFMVKKEAMEAAQKYFKDTSIDFKIIPIIGVWTSSLVTIEDINNQKFINCLKIPMIPNLSPAAARVMILDTLNDKIYKHYYQNSISPLYEDFLEDKILVQKKREHSFFKALLPYHPKCLMDNTGTGVPLILLTEDNEILFVSDYTKEAFRIISPEEFIKKHNTFYEKIRQPVNDGHSSPCEDVLFKQVNLDKQ